MPPLGQPNSNPAAANANANTLTAGKIARLLGRNQGPEFFFQQQWTPLQTVQIPKNVNLNRPLERIIIRLDARIHIVTHDLITFPEGLQSLIQQVQLQGTHQRFGALVPLQLTGADIFAWPSLFKSVGNQILINGVRVNPLGVPNGIPLATFGAAGNSYDVRIFWEIPLVPVVPPAAKLNCVPFLFMQQDWSDTLFLQLTMGDATSLGTQASGGSVTFSALNSDAGNPQFFVYTNYELLGALANQLSTATTIRAIQQVPQGNITAASANLTRLAQLQKYKTLNAVLKSGLLASGTSPGVQVYSSLSDTIFDQTQIRVDNKAIRNNLSNITYKDYLRHAFDALSQPEGYLPMSFIDSLNPRTAFDGDQVSGGSTFEVDSQIISANGANYAEVIQEYFQGVPSGME